MCRLVERLAGVQHVLGAVAELGRGQCRNVGQGEGQRLVLLLGLLFVRGDGARLALDGGHQGVGDGGIDKAAFAVQAGLILLRLPCGGEAAAGVLHHRPDGVVRHGLECLDLAVAGDHEGQRRRLHAAHGQQGARAAALRAQRVRAAEVHADQPVGALPPACSVGPACIGGVLLQRGQAALDGNGVLRAHPKAAHRLAVAEVLQHFVNQQLAFAVGVAGVDDLLGLLEQLADHGELLLRVVLGLENPALGDDGQLIDAPDLLAGLAARHVIGRVLVGVGLFEHVPEAPGHFVGAALDEAVALAGRAQLAGDGLGDGRLFCDEKAHGVSPYQVMTGRITVLICERLIGPK